MRCPSQQYPECWAGCPEKSVCFDTQETPSSLPDDRLLTKADFQSWVIDYAHLYHWRVAHFRSALALARAGRVIFAEIKSEKGELSNDQYKWFVALAGRSEIENYIWRPSDRKVIMEILK